MTEKQMRQNILRVTQNSILQDDFLTEFLTGAPAPVTLTCVRADGTIIERTISNLAKYIFNMDRNETIAPLYVNASIGNDQNSGSSETTALRTIERAISLCRQGTSVTIWLDSNDDDVHVIDNVIEMDIDVHFISANGGVIRPGLCSDGTIGRFKYNDINGNYKLSFRNIDIPLESVPDKWDVPRDTNAFILVESGKLTVTVEGETDAHDEESCEIVCDTSCFMYIADSADNGSAIILDGIDIDVNTPAYVARSSSKLLSVIIRNIDANEPLKCVFRGFNTDNYNLLSNLNLKP